MRGQSSSLVWPATPLTTGGTPTAQITQDSQNNSYGLGNTTANTARGQSFTTVNAFSATRIDFDIQRFGTISDNLYVEITSVSIDGTVIGTSNQVVGSTVTVGGGLVEFTFSSPVSLSAGTKYYARVWRTGAVDAANYYGARASTANPYADGGFFTFNGASWGTESATVDWRFVVYGF